MNFCSHCGSKDLIFQVPEGDNRARFVCPDCGRIHYSNPKIVAGCLPVWQNQVLLCRRAIEPRHGYWNVPSGYMENGETVEEAATREVWEEARARLDNVTLHAIFSIPHINQVYLHFIGEIVDRAFSAGPESLEARLFTEQEIPWEDIAFTSSVFTLEQFFEDLRRGRQLVHLGRMEYSEEGFKNGYNSITDSRR